MRTLAPILCTYVTTLRPGLYGSIGHLFKPAATVPAQEPRLVCTLPLRVTSFGRQSAHIYRARKLNCRTLGSIRLSFRLAAYLARAN